MKMAMAVKPNYVNPLTMMGKKENPLAPHSKAKQHKDLSHDVQDLQIKQQTIQNQILLLKSCSDGAVDSAESQEALEQQLEKIAVELKTAKSQEARCTQSENPGPTKKSLFDHYEKGQDSAEKPGLYQVQRGEDNTYQIIFERTAP